MNRDYFERGCICVLSTELDKAPEVMCEQDAVSYYISNCKCSRHPESNPEKIDKIYNEGLLDVKQKGTGEQNQFGIKTGKFQSRDHIFKKLWHAAIEHYGNSEKFTVVGFEARN